ncbi:MAG: GGDEF domain-containing protein [Chromatiales bacterium]|nr:GGDEF domain-containing protein [Chromatiales bacterium]
MSTVTLFEQTLTLETDRQGFVGHALDAVAALGGRRFAAQRAVVWLMQRLREVGGVSPVAARLDLEDDGRLVVRLGEMGTVLTLTQLERPPEPTVVIDLRERLLQVTQATDPAALAHRNREMERRLEETRQRMQEEMRSLHEALAERQEELRESVRRAETDPLTGLLNRRAFDDRIEHAFRRVLRQKDEHLALMMLDLDHFKEINDQYGHQYGDDYLRGMARAIGAVIRADVDMAFRLGGDEFVVLMFAEGAAVCRKAMQILEQMQGKVSIGIATLSGRESFDGDLRDFIQAADQALYESKRTGRGCVTVDGCNHGSKRGCRRMYESPDIETSAS